MRLVGRDAFDDELSPRDTDGERRRLFEERRQPPREAIDGSDEERMRPGIDRVLVHGHGQLDEQVGVVLLKRGVGGSRDDRAHVEWHPQDSGSPISGARSAPREGRSLWYDDPG